MQYDGNRRIRKTVGTVANNYLYQGEDILAEYANGWAAATGFITHGAATDVPLAWQPAANDPAGPRYFHQDGLGSIVAMSTTAGTTDTERFDAWGEKLVGSGAIPLYGYTGREQDGTPTTGTGFIYYRARYYDPANGRFTQRDPIELKGGINLYTYVGGNPITRVDPTGLLGINDIIKELIPETVETAVGKVRGTKCANILCRKNPNDLQVIEECAMQATPSDSIHSGGILNECIQVCKELILQCSQTSSSACL